VGTIRYHARVRARAGRSMTPPTDELIAQRTQDVQWLIAAEHGENQDRCKRIAETVVYAADQIAALRKERDELRAEVNVAPRVLAEAWAERDTALARVAALEKDAESAVYALTTLLDRFTRLVNSGDCGRWNPEEEPVVIRARAVIADAAIKGGAGMTTFTQRARELCDAATPGPWTCGPVHVIRSKFIDEQGRRCTRYVAECVSGDERDAAYIAALSPDRVRKLLDCIEAGKVLRKQFTMRTLIDGDVPAMTEWDVARAAIEGEE